MSRQTSELPKKVGDPKHIPHNGSQESTGTDAMLTEEPMASAQAKGSDGTRGYPVVCSPVPWQKSVPSELSLGIGGS